MKNWQEEIDSKTRFQFGANWANFLSVLDDARIESAKKSLAGMLKTKSLEGKTFLDVGCGSGLHSLCAQMLGADVYSFDYDIDSVNCTKYLKEKYFENATNWRIEEGSVLDEQYIKSLGQFDIVYSWGVLHHTGEMWKALALIDMNVKPGGQLFIAIYNFQPRLTKYWTFVKKTYNRSLLAKYFWLTYYVSYTTLKRGIWDLIRLKNPLKRYDEYKMERGMSIHHDLKDWLGGYPFEVALPEEIFYFFKDRGYNLEQLKTVGGTVGCNEFIFRKISSPLSNNVPGTQ